MLDTDIFDDHRAQSIKFDDDLAASLIRWHGTRLGKASKALADGRLENGRAFLGRDRQVYGLFQLPVSGCLSYQQLGELVGAQFGQSLDRDLALSRHGSICGHRRWAGYRLYFFVISVRWAARELAMQYDAIEQPDPEIWLELDETERVDLVIDYHRRIGVQLESLELHAMAHVVVENQAALGEATPVPETLERLMDEGLDRHEAVHAIGSILMEIA